MARPIAFAVNLLHTATLLSGSALATKPVTAVADGDPTEEYEASVTTGTSYVGGDQGSGTQTVDRAFVMAGHNLTGLTVHADWSTDVVAWTSAGSVTATAGMFSIPAMASAGFGTLTKRAWRIRAVTPSVPIIITEVAFSVPITFPFAPSDSELVDGYRGQVIRHVGPSGKCWTLRRGAALWEQAYTITNLNALTASTHRDVLLSVYTALADGTRPFVLYDHASTLRFVEWYDADALFQSGALTEDFRVTFRQVA